MEQEIQKLPVKAQLLRRVVRTILICILLILINRLVTPGMKWSLWITAGLAIALLFDLVDFAFIHKNSEREKKS